MRRLHAERQNYCSVIAVNGAWTVWTPMPGPEGECPPGCRVRTRKMVRYCTNPIPQNGGRNCTGAENSTQTCLSEQCDGMWCSLLILDSLCALLDLQKIHHPIFDYQNTIRFLGSEHLSKLD